jgi:leader peptidase (prepilin peptidase)/N-methyltransferase
MELFSFALIGVLGCTVGSFLNVVIYRLPRCESIVFPASHCPSCLKPIAFYDNIPVLSYMFLRGACRSCAVRISPVYPAIELITGLTALLLFLQNGAGLQFASDFAFACILLAAMVIDYRFMIIPDRLNFAGAVIALGLSLVPGWDGGIGRSLLGGLVGSVLMMAMYWLGLFLFGREGIGFGDVKFAAVIGLFTGPFWCLIAVCAAVVLGGSWGIVQLTLKKARLGQEIPFGPFLSLGGFFVLFLKPEILYLIERYLESW